MKHSAPILRVVFITSFALWSLPIKAEYLVKLKSSALNQNLNTLERAYGGRLETISSEGNLFLWHGLRNTDVENLKLDPSVEAIQYNHPIRLFKNPSITSQQESLSAALREGVLPEDRGPAYPDNPEIQNPSVQKIGADPLFSQQWGMIQIGAPTAWNTTPQGSEIVVAVTDTGVDYNHQDLIQNMWRNPKETPNDGIDNDGNGQVDDTLGWDYAANDNKPYDLSLSLMDILFSGGNPGHGTHCAGVVGAQGNNGIGISGVAPKVKIMALRFINEKGQGDTAGAVQVVDYAVKNGAHIISASWGSEGEEAGDFALREAIQRAAQKGVLFIAAAGNGRLNQATFQGEGYDNDADSKPVFPASYPYENIITVAALGNTNELASFSNWGKRSVDIGAPGVKIMSTVPGNRYQDTIVDLGQMKVTWDGTSMATPAVAGALATLWSKWPNLTGAEIKNRLMTKYYSLSQHLTGKVVTDGVIDLRPLQ